MAINTGTPSYSTTAGFILDLDSLIEEAYERCGLQDRTGYELKTARRSINLLIAESSMVFIEIFASPISRSAITVFLSFSSGTKGFSPELS